MAKYSEIIKRMTVEQKASLLTASKGWGNIATGDGSISAMAVADGACGVKLGKGLKFYGAPTTRFPSPLNMARTWNLKTSAYAADVIANEARALGVNVLTTPDGGVSTGSLSEAQNRRFSEDPYLAGKMLSAYVKGYEHGGVMGVVGVNGEIASPVFADEKIHREIALQPYEMAVKDGGVSAICIASSNLNGAPAGENKHLSEIIGTEWQYDGIRFSEDDGRINIPRALALGSSMLISSQSSSEAQKFAKAVHNHKRIVDGINNGELRETTLSNAISQGEAVSEELVDRALEKLFAAVDRYAIGNVEASDKYTSYPFNHAVMFDEREHSRMAYEAALESIVLLKNDGALPIDESKKVMFVGEYLYLPLASCGYRESFSALDNETTSKIVSRAGFKASECVRGYAHNASNSDTAKMRDEAVQRCADADVIVVYVGNLAEDGGNAGKLPEAQIELLSDLKEKTSATVVAVYLGRGLVDMSWNDMCDAVLLAGDPGQGGALAILKILSGAYNPSAKLTETVFASEAITPVEVGMYGYRMCQAGNIEERYPFGHGLSYTEFEYSDIKVSRQAVEFTLTNTGKMAGDEIAQVYIGRDGSAVSNVRKELKGFCKVHLNAGESKSVRIELDSRAFRYYNTSTHSFEIEGGTYQVFVASSSRSIRLLDEVTIPSSGASAPQRHEISVVKGKAPLSADEAASVKKKLASAAKKFAGFVGGIVAFVILGILYSSILRDELFRLLSVRRSDRDMYDFAALIIVVAGVIGCLVGAGFAIRSIITSIARIKSGGGSVSVVSGQTEYKPDEIYPEDRINIVFPEKKVEEKKISVKYLDDESEEEDVAADTEEIVKCHVEKHSSFETLTTGLGTLNKAIEKYLAEVRISVDKNELTELFAAISAGRIVAVRSGDYESVLGVVDAMGECIDAVVTEIEGEGASFKALLSNADTGMARAIDAASSNTDKMNIAVIRCANTTDLAKYFGGLMGYSGSDPSGFEFRMGRGEIDVVTIPNNMWFIAVISDDVCTDTQNACVVRLHADVSARVDIDTAIEQDSENSVIDTYSLNCRAFADMIDREREMSYLSERYWRKIDKLEEHINADIPFALSNKTVNAMERFIAICVSSGMEQTAAMDSVLAAIALAGIRSDDASKIGADEPLTEFMDTVFGADTDDKSREAVRFKGIK